MHRGFMHVQTYNYVRVFMWPQHIRIENEGDGNLFGCIHNHLVCNEQTF